MWRPLNDAVEPVAPPGVWPGGCRICWEWTSVERHFYDGYTERPPTPPSAADSPTARAAWSSPPVVGMGRSLMWCLCWSSDLCVFRLIGWCGVCGVPGRGCSWWAGWCFRGFLPACGVGFSRFDWVFAGVPGCTDFLCGCSGPSIGSRGRGVVVWCGSRSLAGRRVGARAGRGRGCLRCGRGSCGRSGVGCACEVSGEVTVSG